MSDGLASRCLQALVASQTALGQHAQALSPATWQALCQAGLKLERPKHVHHGDFALNVSFLAKHTRLAPPAIAEAVVPHFSLGNHATLNVIGGFINLTLTPHALTEHTLALHQQPALGQSNAMAGQRILLEYISANPTGPLHIGHGRWAALGDSIARILRHNGATVETEFYVNDQGQQMSNMANSVWFRALDTLGLATWETLADDMLALLYPGEYVVSIAQAALADPPLKQAIEATFAQHGGVRLETLLPDNPLHTTLRLLARDAMLADQRTLLDRLGVHFDHWLMESTLHQQGLVPETLAQLQADGHTVTEEEAIWLNTTAWGDEKNRVLVKSDGQLTYFMADIAYHKHKLTRQPAFTELINIWGADHHGYVARMHAAVQALGYPKERLTIILGQLVTLLVNGEKARMGKRTKMLTLAELTDEVGVDAVRFWLVNRSADHTIEFDLELAAQQSEANPVFYVQYAHARLCSLLRNALEPTLCQATSQPKPALLTEAQWQAFQSDVTAETLAQHLWQPLADNDKSTASLKALLLLLHQFQAKVEEAGRVKSPHTLARYVQDVAGQFHSFYAHCRVLTDDAPTTMARLLVVQLTRNVVAQGLHLLGVSAPDRM
jgi:arginyl-tRNA synthetase